ncbi:Alpha/beta hydrolase [Sinosporangium album]|uniref:Alpha/beta hydrolase n=2 Tax=Sinosporangium album TaxID=504805 RepID=A0A1G8LSU4_9ACTN|nr:Alpha/beta hydrolase [Sinosporangium album]
MGGQAWVGGGASEFNAQLVQHHRNLQRAFESALNQLADRVAQTGEPRPAVPPLGTSASFASSGSNGFRGVNPEAMNSLITSLRTASRQLSEAGQVLHAELTRQCVSSRDATAIGHIGSWAEQQEGQLRRRLEALQRDEGAMDASSPMPASLVAYGLFDGHAPTGKSGLTTALDKAGRGDQTALETLLRLQNRGDDPTFASRVNSWWRMLGPKAQRSLTEAHPRHIGALNGVPSTTRDQANRTHLADEKSRINGLLLTLPLSLAQARIDGKEKAFLTLANSIAQQKKNLDTIEYGLSRGGQSGRATAYLLGFDLAGTGRAIVSYGDPDTADRVVAYTPGLGTRLDNFQGDFNRVTHMWDRAHALAPTLKHASIAWLGYEPPQKDINSFLKEESSVASATPAKNGAAFLAAFSDALRATQIPRKDGEAPRLTMLGHSYGSLVTGLATQRRPGFTDGLIFVGSPGVGAMHAKDLGVSPTDVWVGEAYQDIVAKIGSLPEYIDKASLPHRLLSPNYWVNYKKPLPHFGADPGSDEFGAQRFYVEPTGTEGAHSSYWEPRSQSLENIAHIINGDHHKTTGLPGR